MTLSRYSLATLFVICILTSIARSNVDSSLTFYPLQKGNVWQFRSTYTQQLLDGSTRQTTHYYSVAVSGDTVLSNGKRYYLIRCSDTSIVHPQYQRIDSTTSQVLAFDTSNGGQEYVIDSLQAPFGSTFSGCRLRSRSITYVSAIDSQNVLGSKRRCRHYVTPVFVGPAIEYMLAESIGITAITNGYVYDMAEYNSVRDTLTYARIGGKDYGTLVSVSEAPQTARSFILEQNYPNPFNPSTTIRYQLSTKSNITLKIFDILGNLIATLVNQKQNAGIYNVTFTGNTLATGVYFYRLTAGDFVEAKKLVILK